MTSGKAVPAIYFLIFFYLFSCKSKQKIVPAVTSPESISAIENKAKENTPAARNLIRHLKENEFNFTTLSLKTENKAELNGGEAQEFNATIRIKKDSAIWVSINALLGIEVVRCMITQDSVKLINRIDNTFFMGNFDYLNNLLKSDLDFPMLQAILVGNAFDYYEDERLKASKTDSLLFLGTVRKRKLRKVLEKDKELKDPLESIWILPNSYRVKRVYLEDFSVSRSFSVSYNNHEMIDSLLLPREALFEINAEKSIKMLMNINKATRNSEIAIPFKIPEKFTPIKGTN